MTGKKRIHDVEGLNARLQEITRRARIDMRYLHDDRSRQHIVAATLECTRILDVGAGMRDHLGALGDRVETLDLNDFGDAEIPGPDILGDVCSPFPDWMEARYDAVIALAILEHVYDPAAAGRRCRDRRHRPTPHASGAGPRRRRPRRREDPGARRQMTHKI